MNDLVLVQIVHSFEHLPEDLPLQLFVCAVRVRLQKLLEGLTVAELHLNVEDDNTILVFVTAFAIDTHHFGLHDRLLVVIERWRHLGFEIACILVSVELAFLAHQLLLLILLLIVVLPAFAFIIGNDVLFLGRLLVRDRFFRFLLVRRPTIEVLCVGSRFDEPCLFHRFCSISLEGST